MNLVSLPYASLRATEINSSRVFAETVRATAQIDQKATGAPKALRAKQ